MGFERTFRFQSPLRGGGGGGAPALPSAPSLSGLGASAAADLAREKDARSQAILETLPAELAEIQKLGLQSPEGQQKLIGVKTKLLQAGVTDDKLPQLLINAAQAGHFFGQAKEASAPAVEQLSGPADPNIPQADPVRARTMAGFGFRALSGQTGADIIGAEELPFKNEQRESSVAARQITADKERDRQEALGRIDTLPKGQAPSIGDLLRTGAEGAVTQLIKPATPSLRDTGFTGLGEAGRAEVLKASTKRKLPVEEVMRDPDIIEKAATADAQERAKKEARANTYLTIAQNRAITLTDAQINRLGALRDMQEGMQGLKGSYNKMIQAMGGDLQPDELIALRQAATSSEGTIGQALAAFAQRHPELQKDEVADFLAKYKSIQRFARGALQDVGNLSGFERQIFTDMVGGVLDTSRVFNARLDEMSTRSAKSVADLEQIYGVSKSLPGGPSAKIPQRQPFNPQPQATAPNVGTPAQVPTISPEDEAANFLKKYQQGGVY
jgi:hypothetical protein